MIDITDFKRYTEKAPYLAGRSFCDIEEEKIFLPTRPFETLSDIRWNRNRRPLQLIPHSKISIELTVRGQRVDLLYKFDTFLPNE